MTFLVSSVGHDWGLMNCPLLTLTWNPLETYSSIKWAKIKVGVVMTFVWMNYGRMVGDSTLQTVNTTGLILQVGTLSRAIYYFAVYLCQWIIAGHIRLLVLLHHITQASGREEDLLNHPPPLHHWHVHHHCWGKTCKIPHIQTEWTTLFLKDLEAITQNIGWLGATMSFAYCSAPLASIQEVAVI